MTARTVTTVWLAAGVFCVTVWAAVIWALLAVVTS